MKIRPMEIADIATVHSMILALGAYHGDLDAKVTPETLRRDGFGPHPWVRFLVAYDDAGIHGYAAVLPLAKIVDGLRGIDINHMYITEDRRRHGIGRALIEAAAEIGRDLACSYMFIGTAPDNISAQNAYLACGFERWGESGPRFRREL